MKALSQTIKFEFKKHWKLMVSSVTLVYFLKYVLYLLHKHDYGKPVGDAIVLMFFIGAAVTVYLGAAAISSEREKNTLAFLFTRHSDRRFIITGKIISALIMVVFFILFTTPALTPAPFIETSWIGSAFEFIYNDALFFTGLVSILLGIPFLWSSFSKTISTAYLFSVLSVCITVFIVIKFISFEALWLTNIFLFATAVTIVNTALGKGEILPEKAVLKKSLKLLAYTFPVYIIFLFICGTALDIYYTPDSTSPVYTILDRPFNNRLVTSRAVEPKSHFSRPFGELSYTSTKLKDGLVASKGMDLTNNKWEPVLKRNQTAVSVSPDNSKLLYLDKRHVFGMLNTEKPYKICLKTKSDVIDLGVTRGYSPSFAWLPDNSLIYWLSGHNFKESRKNNSRIFNNKLNMISTDGKITHILEIDSYSLGTTHVLNSGSHIVLELKKVDGKRIIALIDIKNGSLLEIERKAKAETNDIKIMSTLDTRMLVKRKGKKQVLDFAELIKKEFNPRIAKDVSDNFNKYVTSEVIEGVYKNARLTQKGWTAFTNDYQNDKMDTLLKFTSRVGSRMIDKEFTFKGYTSLKTCWNNDHTKLAVFMVCSSEYNKYRAEYQELIDSPKYRLAPFYYTRHVWKDCAKKVDISSQKLMIFDINDTNVRKREIFEKKINLYDYYITFFTWLSDTCLAASYGNRVELIKL